MSTRDYDTALASVDRDGRIIALLEKINRAHMAEIESLHAELAELRDAFVTLKTHLDAVVGVTSTELRALSNRLEAVTRTVGSGLYSVKS